MRKIGLGVKNAHSRFPSAHLNRSPGRKRKKKGKGKEKGRRRDRRRGRGRRRGSGREVEGEVVRTLPAR